MLRENVTTREAFATAFGFGLCIGIAWLFIYAMLWSLEEERKLGISGRSSESLLLEHEKGEE